MAAKRDSKKLSKTSERFKLSDAPPSTYNGFKSSNSPPLCYFSNFFVSEFTFMSFRTANPRLKALYIAMRDYNWDSVEGYERFIRCRQLLQPSTKKKYAEKTNYNGGYLKKAQPSEPRVAAGVLAKLISGCWRVTARKRLAVVNEMADEWLTEEQRNQWQNPILSTDFIDGTIEQKKEWMMSALQHKYSIPFFKDLLCTTDDGWLWERGGSRDVNSNFTGEKGLLTVCLKETKANMSDCACNTSAPSAKKQRTMYKHFALVRSNYFFRFF